MAKRSRVASEDLPQPDRVDGQPHPRQVHRLVGHERAIEIAAKAIKIINAAET